MAKNLIGHCDCPECGKEAEVGKDKRDNLYRYCPDCNAQYFTRGDKQRTENVLAKTRLLKVEAPPAPEQSKPAATPAPAAAPAAPPKKPATAFG